MAIDAWPGAGLPPQMAGGTGGGDTYNRGLGLTGGKDFAQQAFANLTRQQWDDYLTNYVPVENRMIEYAMDESNPNEAAYIAGRGVEQAFDTQRAGAQRRLAGMGLTLTAEEQAASDKQSRLSESLATVGAMNNARDATRSRQQSVIGNPTPQLPKGGF